MATQVQEVSDKTRVPIIWIAALVPVVTAVALSFASLRSDVQVTTTKVEIMEKHQEVVDSEIKSELRRLSDKIDKALQKGAK